VPVPRPDSPLPDPPEAAPAELPPLDGDPPDPPALDPPAPDVAAVVLDPPPGVDDVVDSETEEPAVVEPVLGTAVLLDELVGDAVVDGPLDVDDPFLPTVSAPTTPVVNRAARITMRTRTVFWLFRAELRAAGMRAAG
jgi:hypothetical protein